MSWGNNSFEIYFEEYSLHFFKTNCTISIRHGIRGILKEKHECNRSQVLQMHLILPHLIICYEQLPFMF